jgi:regulator of sirC expression with transglutaminase-like and TPR domain
MRRQTRTVLLGAFAAAALAAIGAGVWFLAPSVSPLILAPPEEALPLPPESPRLVENEDMAQCLALLRTDPEGALALASAWDRREPNEGARHCQALALLSLGEAVQAATRLEALASRSSAGAVARAAVFAQATQAWLMAGDANRAVGAATLALTLTPEDPAALTDRALALGLLGRFAAAVQDLDDALRHAPDRVEALVFRAAAYRQLDRRQQALADVTRALMLDPGNAEALLERGILRQLQGDAAGAREDWERAITVAPDSAAADLAAQNLALSDAAAAPR